MDDMKLKLILGSIREGRKTVHVAEHIYKLFAAQEGIDAELIDLRTYQLPQFASRWNKEENPDPALVEVCQKLTEADGLIFISPEYHGSYTGVLKNAVDHYWKEFKKKPIGVVATGAGSFGGINASTEMQQLVLSIGAFPMPQKLIVPHVQHTFEEDGTPISEKYVAQAEMFVSEYLWFATAITEAHKNERRQQITTQTGV